jgi:UDP-N-acetylmuramate dehydrogenase
MVGIPGSVGGAVRMNAGGHGSDMASVLAGVHIVDLASGEDYEVAPAHLGLRFRGSDLDDRHVVVSARFELAPGDRTGPRPRSPRSSGGAASTSPAARTAARCSSTPSRSSCRRAR